MGGRALVVLDVWPVVEVLLNVRTGTRGMVGNESEGPPLDEPGVGERESESTSCGADADISDRVIALQLRGEPSSLVSIS